jgi:hypothetical protein
MIYDVPLTEVDKTTLDKRFQDIIKKNNVFILDNVHKNYQSFNLPTLISLEFAGWESYGEDDYRKYLNVFIIHPHEEDLKEPIDAMSKLIDDTSYFGDYDKLIDIKIHSLFNKEPS